MGQHIIKVCIKRAVWRLQRQQRTHLKRRPIRGKLLLRGAGGDGFAASFKGDANHLGVFRVQAECVPANIHLVRLILEPLRPGLALVLELDLVGEQGVSCGKGDGITAVLREEVRAGSGTPFARLDPFAQGFAFLFGDVRRDYHRVVIPQVEDQKVLRRGGVLFRVPVRFQGRGWQRAQHHCRQKQCQGFLECSHEFPPLYCSPRVLSSWGE